VQRAQLDDSHDHRAGQAGKVRVPRIPKVQPSLRSQRAFQERHAPLDQELRELDTDQQEASNWFFAFRARPLAERNAGQAGKVPVPRVPKVQPSLKSSPSPFALVDRLRAERKAERAAKVRVARILAAEPAEIGRNGPWGDTDA